LVLSRRPLGAILHSSNELGDDSTINIVLDIIIIIIIIITVQLIFTGHAAGVIVNLITTGAGAPCCHCVSVNSVCCYNKLEELTGFIRRVISQVLLDDLCP